VIGSQQERTYSFDLNEAGDFRLGLVAYLRGCVGSTFADVAMHTDGFTIVSVDLALSSFALHPAAAPKTLSIA